MYEIQYTNSARRYFKKLRKKDKTLLEKMSIAIEEISLNPYTAGVPKKGDLSGIYGYDVYHQGSNYEIAYRLDTDDDGNIILILLAGNRENFYDQLKRYMK